MTPAPSLLLDEYYYYYYYLNIITYMDRRISLDVVRSRKTLVLGFYNRGNLGDDAFAMMFPIFFRHIGAYDLDVVYACTDDVNELPPGVEMVIVGGGDVINSYFMPKVQKLVASFAGPVYALSVGIPFDADAERYLHVFDHVFVRNRHDADLAGRVIGERNVTYIPDLTLVWQTTKAFASNPFVQSSPMMHMRRQLDVGVCIAAPLLRSKPEVGAALQTALTRFLLAPKNSNVNLHFFAFNTNRRSTKECDIFAMQGMAALFPRAVQKRVHLHDQATLNPEQMINRLASMDMNLCMRFHSVVFSYMANTPFVALFETKKVRTILQDMQYTQEYIIDLSVPTATATATTTTTTTATNADVDVDVHQRRQLMIDEERIFTALQDMTKDKRGLMECVGAQLKITPQMLNRARVMMSTPGTTTSTTTTSTSTTTTAAAAAAPAPPGGGIATDVKYHYKSIKIRPRTTMPRDAAVRRVMQNLSMYFQTHVPEQVLDAKGPLEVHGKDKLVVARIICNAITGDVSHPCVWGLKDNMSAADFCLRDSINYIYQDFNRVTNKGLHTMLSGTQYYDDMPVARRTFAIIDPYVNHNVSNVHRSGWSYVVGTMMNIDAGHNDRKGEVIVDTFADQTFLWGQEALIISGALPYKQPWIGFLHHTFDPTHSKYNLVTLFNDAIFIESLKTCRCIVTLSEYLASQIRSTLEQMGHRSVEVAALVHPTLFVSHNFTWQRFMQNPDKRIIAVGAWLRNPYSIYALPLAGASDERFNPMNLRKCHLKGASMSAYFPPEKFFSQFYRHYREGANEGDNTAHECDGPTEETLCRSYFDNKFVGGLYSKITDDFNSVEVIQRVTNEEFDCLFAENVVFLDLIDCSAVNTVLECIARNTILIVNRHPAVEELLGSNYAGFYSSLFEAAFIVGQPSRLRHIHEQMCKLDKSKLRIEAFMTDLQDVIERALYPSSTTGAVEVEVEAEAEAPATAR